ELKAMIHIFFFSSRRRHTRFSRDWSSDVCSSDLGKDTGGGVQAGFHRVEAVLVVEVAGQGAGEAEEAAEGDAVEEHEPPAVAVAEGLEIVAQGLGPGPLGRIPGDPGEDDQG